MLLISGNKKIEFDRFSSSMEVFKYFFFIIIATLDPATVMR